MRLLVPCILFGLLSACSGASERAPATEATTAAPALETEPPPEAGEQSTLSEALADLAAFRQRARNVVVQDKGKRFNTDLMDAVEIGFMVDYAEAFAGSARHRTESRGAHLREDFPKRNDDEWLRHTLFFSDGNGTIEMGDKPVTVTRFQPKERKY